MQEKYVSLDPTYAATRQAFIDRDNVYQQRYQEARGGAYAQQLGFILGLTASTYMYQRAQKQGFTGFFPLTRRNAGHYALILGAGFLAYHIGSSWVSNVTGDI